MGSNRIYLVGHIGGLTHDGCTEWRDYVIENIDSRIEAFDPMRGKSFLRSEGVLGRQGYEHPMATPKGIMARDFSDVIRADALLVNLSTSDEVSLGSVMEIAWGFCMQKPVIVVMGDDNPHQHLMVNQAASYVVDSLDTAIVLVEALLLPDTRR